MPETPDRYTHGHHPAVLRSHAWRTAENSAGFLLPRLRAGQDLLDVGCGPGTISADLAARVGPGIVHAIDRAAEVIARARDAYPDVPNLRFAEGDAYRLDFADETFDVVYAHQVLQHLVAPVDALREVRRVLRPEGVAAIRDADFGAFAWYPDDPRLTRWLELYFAMTAVNKVEPRAGRRLVAWCHEAGFERLEVTSSNWTFQRDEDRAWWGGLWAERVRESEFARQGLEYGLTSLEELADISDAFLAWSTAEDGVFVVMNVEVLATK